MCRGKSQTGSQDRAGETEGMMILTVSCGEVCHTPLLCPVDG